MSVSYRPSLRTVRQNYATSCRGSSASNLASSLVLVLSGAKPWHTSWFRDAQRLARHGTAIGDVEQREWMPVDRGERHDSKW